MKKTITIEGQTYNGSEIADRMDAAQREGVPGDKIITLAGYDFVAQYRHDEGDGYHAPKVSSRARANCIFVECEELRRKEWIVLPASNNPAAVLMGQMTSPKKAGTSRENGKRGGRPRKVVTE